jgi:hypothetical protein
LLFVPWLLGLREFGVEGSGLRGLDWKRRAPLLRAYCESGVAVWNCRGQFITASSLIVPSPNPRPQRYPCLRHGVRRLPNDHPKTARLSDQKRAKPQGEQQRQVASGPQRLCDPAAKADRRAAWAPTAVARRARLYSRVVGADNRTCDQTTHTQPPHLRCPSVKFFPLRGFSQALTPLSFTPWKCRSAMASPLGTPTPMIADRMRPIEHRRSGEGGSSLVRELCGPRGIGKARLGGIPHAAN